MTSEEDIDDRINQLLSDFVEEEISIADLQELQNILEESSSMRRLFLRYLSVYTGLLQSQRLGHVESVANSGKK